MSHNTQDVALRHQLRIARDTLKLSDVGASILGGMTKDEARELLKRHGLYTAKIQALDEQPEEGTP